MPEPPRDNVVSSDDNPKHPLATAAKAGFGPLSVLGTEQWHGDSLPCPSCARLNRRKAKTCQHCGQDLSQEILEKMAKLSGPWFVYDNIHPFPGVSLDRLLIQIKRGVLTRTSIVRGPTTFYQWRYATETPLIARHLNHCWSCQEDTTALERYCPKCKAVLDGYYRPGQLAAAPLETSHEPSAQLAELHRALDDSEVQTRLLRTRGVGRHPLGRAPLIFFAVGLVLVLTLVWLLSASDRKPQPSPAAPSEVGNLEAPPASSQQNES